MSDKFFQRCYFSIHFHVTFLVTNRSKILLNCINMLLSHLILFYHKLQIAEIQKMRLSKIWNRNYLKECKRIDLQTCLKSVWKASKALENHMKFEFFEWHWISKRNCKSFFFDWMMGRIIKFCQKAGLLTQQQYIVLHSLIYEIRNQTLFNAAYASDPRIQLLHANQIIVVEKRKVKIGLAVFLLLSLF